MSAEFKFGDQVVRLVNPGKHRTYMTQGMMVDAGADYSALERRITRKPSFINPVKAERRAAEFARQQERKQDRKNKRSQSY